MKIIYCNHSVCNPGGMERVLFNKACFLSRMGWEILVVTTDQNGRPPFYPFPEEIRMVDLDINYSSDNIKSLPAKISGYLRKRRLHRKRLTQVLMQEKADIVVSLYPSESSFIPRIKDGSKKILEFHYCKLFRLQYGRSGLLGLIDRWRTRQDERIVGKFDRFVTLTEEDRRMWECTKLKNGITIPNAAMPVSPSICSQEAKRVIAVGRLDYQKGFDRLIEAWAIVQNKGDFSDWHLDIFGRGEWEEMLKAKIEDLGIGSTVSINAPTKNIGKEYAQSSLMAMTSNYEGFPMVMLEGMAQGLPVVTFDYLCGPRDIIRDGWNGLLVSNGDIPAFAEALMRAMEDSGLRKEMSTNALKSVERYSEENVMKQWLKLFDELLSHE